jgi:peptidyl-prolyl cis-trans isomerase C
MSSQKIFFVSIFVFAVITTSACTPPPDRVVLAHVDGQKILVADLRSFFNEQKNLYAPEILKDPEGAMTVKKRVLNELIEEKILLAEAARKKISLNDEEKKSLEDESREGYQKGELEKILKEQNLSVDDWMEKKERRRLTRKLIEQEVIAKVDLPEEEIEDEYQKNRSQYRLPDRMHCLHIVAGKRDKAQTIRALLDKGENFANIARQYSESPDRDQGGDLGYIVRGQFPDIFERACFSLATGQTSDVLASEYGFHIFRVTERLPGRQKTLKEVEPEIASRLREEKAQILLGPWLESLYRKTKIAIDEKALERFEVGHE